MEPSGRILVGPRRALLQVGSLVESTDYCGVSRPLGSQHPSSDTGRRKWCGGRVLALGAETSMQIPENAGTFRLRSSAHQRRV